MRVLVLTPYLYGTAPGPRSSIELWEPALQEAGITFEYAPFETERLHEVIYEPGGTSTKVAEMLRAYMRRVPELRNVRKFDAVLVYREAALIGPALFERWIARRGVPIIYQLDDPLYVPYRSASNGYLSYLKFFGKVGPICRLSSVVIANSRFHREFASRFNRNVWEIPSVVDAERYQYLPSRPDPEAPVCVGWTGSGSTTGNLSIIRDVLAELGERRDVRIHFIGGERFDLPGVKYTSQPWSPATEVEDLRRLDIGLLPVPVDEWTKRKFYLKLVQYMTLGIPAVCTPVGSTPDVIEDGVTGFLASGVEEWRNSVCRLIEDPAFREQMGERAARVAHERYTLQGNANRIVDAFRSVRS